MDALLAGIVTFIATFLLIVGVFGYIEQENNLDRFKSECDKVGGFVAETEAGFWSWRYDCIKDNEIVYLPGFA